MNLATNQRAQRRDRTNVCMCHLDHLLQLPWAHFGACRPPKPRAPNMSLRMTSITARVKISRCAKTKILAALLTNRIFTSRSQATKGTCGNEDVC
jgi:hypothetical protein